MGNGPIEIRASVASSSGPGGCVSSRGEFTPDAVRAALGVWIGFLVGPNVMLASTNGIFMADLARSFEVGRGAISAALAASVWCVGLLVPFSGRAMDRYGARPLIVGGVVLFALSLAAIGAAQNFWQYLALQFLLAVAASLHGSVGYSKVAAQWFDRRRGVVLGLCVAMGSGLGQILMPKITLALIQGYGWRGGYLGIAAIVFLLGLPLIALLIRTPGHDVRMPRRLAEIEQSGFTRAEALRQPTFYLLFFGIFLASLSLIGTLQHAVPMLIERGLTPGAATTVLSCIFVGVLLGESSSGFLVDRFNSPRVVLPYFAAAWLGLMTVHSAAGMPSLIVGGVLMGLGLGCETGQNAYLTSRYFGLKSFGEIFGLTYLAVCAGIGCGLILMGAIRDYFGSYDPTLYVFGFTMALSVLCIALLRPFPFKPTARH